MRTLLIACWCSVAAWLTHASPLFAQDPVAQRYIIDATYDAVQHSVRGRVDIALTNRSSRALNELLFHLYLNAFRDDRSVFMRESGGVLRAERSSGRGSSTVSALRVDGKELLASAQTELVPGDLTQLRVPLITPIEPGASARISIDFVSQFPPLFARSGYAGDLLIAAQWFPKLAKLEPDGTFRGFPYHALGEFYADFADYEVTVSLPASLQLGCTGAVVERTKKGALQRVLMRAQRVHDFAWVASPSLTLTKRRLGAVDVTFMAPDSYGRALAEHMFVVEKGLAQFAAQYGAYPYATLTVVVPPRGADGGAGMEYPSLIVTDGTWLPTPWAPSLSGAVVTAHELAHQWFYGLLASDEVRFPVLDEGLAEWATLDLLRASYGRVDPLAAWLKLDTFEWARIALRDQPAVAEGLPAYDYTADEYGASVYGRSVIALETIRRAHGDARFRRALARYAELNRFKHPTPAALSAAFDEVYGAGFAARVLEPLLMQGVESAIAISAARQTKQGDHYEIEVRLRRRGVALPTWVRLYDEKGKELAKAPVHDTPLAPVIALRSSTGVARVVVDAERALLLDDDVRDQVWVFKRERERALTGKLVALAQALVAWLGP